MSSAAGYPDAAEHWNRRYAGEDFLFGTEPNGWLREHAARFPAGGRVLCVADGEGRNSVWLAGQGLQVEAFDISERAITKARSHARRAGVQVDFSQADCDQFSWPQDRYDGIAAIFIQFADPALRARLFDRIVHSLRPGGVLILQGYTPKQLDYKTGGPPTCSHLYTEALLREAFASLQMLALRDYEADVQEGRGHSGRSALIGMVALR